MTPQHLTPQHLLMPSAMAPAPKQPASRGGNFTTSKSKQKRSQRSENASSNSRKASPTSPLLSAADLTHDALELLRQFLAYVDPAAADELPVDRPVDAEVPIPISQWNVIYHTDQPTAITSSITVSSYPSPSKNLFCVQSVLPRVSTRQFWTLMAESGNRHLWDSTVHEGGNFRWLQDELRERLADERQVAVAGAIAARIEYLRMGAIFMVAKPRDMVLLSADVRLPSTHDSPLRMVSSCRSQEDPSKPPIKGYTRWDLGVGGFMVEELGHDGISTGSGDRSIRVTQLSDLGELASWVPSSVVKMVASTLVPYSLNVISKVAQSIQPPRALRDADFARNSRLRDEHVVKGRERWSHGRGIPIQVGNGVLQRPTSTKALGSSEPAQDAVEASSLAKSNETQDSTNSRDPYADEGLPRGATEQPLLSLSIQNLSTRLLESGSSPLAPGVNQRLADEGCFRSTRRDGSITFMQNQYDTNSFHTAGTLASELTSSRTTLSEASTRLTFGVPSGKRTVPESIDSDFSHGSTTSSGFHPSRCSSAHSSHRVGASLGDQNHSIQLPDEDQSLELAHHFEAASLHQKHHQSTSPQLSLASASDSTTPITMDGISEEDLEASQASQLNQRLQSMSRALIHYHASEKSQDEVPPPNVSVNPGGRKLQDVPETLSREYEESDSGDDDDKDKYKDEVISILVEAVSIPLQSPQRRGTPILTPVMPYSPSHTQARREASELSAILLAGSGALVTALAPGARETIVSPASGLAAPAGAESGGGTETEELSLELPSDGNSHLRGCKLKPSNISASLEINEPPSPHSLTEAETNPSAKNSLSPNPRLCEELFSGSKPVAKRSISSAAAQVVAQTTSVHAQHRSVGQRSIISTVETPDDVLLFADDDRDEDEQAAESDGDKAHRSHIASRKRAWRNVSYSLALGMMAIVWATSRPVLCRRRKAAGSAKPSRSPACKGFEVISASAIASFSETHLQRPSAAVEATRRALLLRSKLASSASQHQRQQQQPENSVHPRPERMARMGSSPVESSHVNSRLEVLPKEANAQKV